MTNSETLLLLILLLGVTIVLAMFNKAVLERLGVPALIGYLLRPLLRRWPQTGVLT